jgi:hypothetical protein
MPRSMAGLLPDRAGAICLMAIICLVCCIRSYVDPLNHTVFPDYAHAGTSWAHGTDAYEISRDAEGNIIPRMSGYRYSPLVSIFLVPFSILPMDWGGALWRLLSCLVFMGAFARLIRALGGSNLNKKAQAALWLLILPMSLGSIHNGQANVLLMGLLLAAAAAVMEERWNWAACFLAGACFLKVYPLAVALLFVLVYPRQLGWRFGLALVAGLALPFALQHPSYVYEQYRNWYDLVATDNRRDYPMDQGYRDFYLLTRFFGVPMAAKAYLALQLGAAALTAGICWFGRLRNWPKEHLVQTLLGLGCCWMVVFGPSTESSTFILIGPSLALAIVGPWLAGRPGALVPALVMAMFLLTFTATWFPGGRNWFYVLQPLSAALFFLDRVLHAKPLPAPPAALTGTMSRAA